MNRGCKLTFRFSTKDSIILFHQFKIWWYKAFQTWSKASINMSASKFLTILFQHSSKVSSTCFPILISRILLIYKVSWQHSVCSWKSAILFPRLPSTLQENLITVLISFRLKSWGLIIIRLRSKNLTSIKLEDFFSCTSSSWENN